MRGISRIAPLSSLVPARGGFRVSCTRRALATPRQGARRQAFGGGIRSMDDRTTARCINPADLQGAVQRQISLKCQSAHDGGECLGNYQCAPRRAGCSPKRGQSTNNQN